MSKKKQKKAKKELDQTTSNSDNTEDLQTPKTETSKKTKLILAPLSIRAKVFILDTFMIYTPILYIIVYVILGDKENFLEHQEYPLIATILYGIIIAFLQSIKKQSIGGKAYDVIVVNSMNGKSITFLVALFRFALSLVSITFLFGLIMAMLNSQKRTFHDIVCKTIVLQNVSKE